jgi:hypothetical protein
MLASASVFKLGVDKSEAFLCNLMGVVPDLVGCNQS